MYSALSLHLLIILIKPFCTFLYRTIFSFVVSPFSRENPAKRRFFLYSYSLNLSVLNTICNQLPTSPRTPATCESNTENPKPNQRHTEKKISAYFTDCCQQRNAWYSLSDYFSICICVYGFRCVSYWTNGHTMPLQALIPMRSVSVKRTERVVCFGLIRLYRIATAVVSLLKHTNTIFALECFFSISHRTRAHTPTANRCVPFQ